MASVHDVAAFIVAELGEVGAMKPPKLVYYAQAWSLVWDDRPLFPEHIEAWDRGRVVGELYRENKNRPSVDRQRYGNRTS
jgi:uncharacterized phage-associated protein